jgi:hypothetical protein
VNLTSWLSQSISVAAQTGKNSKGDPTYGTPVTVSARVEVSRRFARNAQGQKTVSSHAIYTTTAIALTDRIWLPGVSTSNVQAARGPLSVTAVSDKAGGVTLYEVLLG